MTAAQAIQDRTTTEPTETERIANELLLAAIAVERFSADMTARVMTRFQEMEKELIAEILDMDVAPFGGEERRKRRIADLMSLASEIVHDTYDDIIAQVSADLQTVAAASSDATSGALALVLGLALLPMSRLRLREIAEESMFQGATVDEWFQKHEADALFRFRRTIQQGMEDDMSSGEIVDVILGDDLIQRRDGIFQQTRRNAEVLITTIAAAVGSAARLATITEAKTGGDRRGGGTGAEGTSVIKAVGQLSVLDHRTSTVCIAYSGKKWSLPDYVPIGHNLPFAGGCPRHWRCRSQIIPIIDPKEKVTGTQKSESGQVPASWTYEDWLMSRSEEEQRDILGAGRYDLWKAGKLSVSDLVDQRGNPLTVAALVKRYSNRPTRRPS